MYIFRKFREGWHRRRFVEKESPSAIVLEIMRKLGYERQPGNSTRRSRCEQISAVEPFVSRFTDPEGAKRIKRVRWRFLFLFLSFLCASRSLLSTCAPLYHPRYQLSFSLYRTHAPLRTHNEHWTLETENMGDRKGKEGIAARGSADDYGVVNLPGSSAPSAVLCTASRWRWLKKLRPLLRLVSHRLALFMFINWEIRYKCVVLKRHSKNLSFSLIRSLSNVKHIISFNSWIKNQSVCFKMLHIKK